jgi:hypothetical protein
MNLKEIEELLEKFYEGFTTLEEEQQLRNYFTGEAIPPHLSEHADLFRFYAVSGKEELSDPEFVSRFLSTIEEAPVISLFSGRKGLLVLAGIAAAILIFAGMIFIFRNNVIRPPSKNDVNTEVAYLQAKNALVMLSANFNTGLNEAEKLENFQKGLKEVQKLQAFQKGIDQINKLSKFYQYQQIIINPGDQYRP